MTFFDDGQNENFSDQPEEINGKYDPQGNWIADSSPPVQVKVEPSQVSPSSKTNMAVKPDMSNTYEQEDEKIEEEESEDNSLNVLNDARLRLEQGRLYEMVMKHDIFEGVDADSKAIKNVQKEIRSYAQERMEIMLGMRQEVKEEPVIVNLPFNELEIEALKALAATATNGASRKVEDEKLKKPARTTLNSIKSSQNKAPKADAPKSLSNKSRPIRREVSASVQRILQEEGLTMEEINSVMDGQGIIEDGQLKMPKLTEEEIIKRNASVRNKKATSKDTVPIPPFEKQLEYYSHGGHSAGMPKEPGWQALLAGTMAMPPTKFLNSTIQENNINPMNYEKKS